ncbi:MAG: hypothetical protein NZ553_15670 [Caldilinea sp.]|nr:hypothetical protein [Caldilinea sp.]MDW8441914.1 hypothetical protein [Caldilineaceae bacterium]
MTETELDPDFRKTPSKTANGYLEGVVTEAGQKKVGGVNQSNLHL